MKAVVIGGSGHIGTYLIPKLVWAGFSVVNVSRGQSKPYTLNKIWDEVESVILDRDKEIHGDFEKKIAALNADIVIDLINFDLESTRRITDALMGTNLSHYLFCSSIWAHGKATIFPASEDLPRYPLCEYGKEKAACEAYLHKLFHKKGFPETSILPGQISGAGWNIINPTGNIDPMIFQRIARGQEIALPSKLGMETLHHVHADDVAQVFMNSVTHRSQALGESFHAVSAESITLLGYANAMYRWFGKEPKISCLSWDEWCSHTNNEELCKATYLHIARSGSYSIEKGKRLIEYSPRHTILEAITESVTSMTERGVIKA
jgi:nucleoside-diphosphate-sugar epimerase